MKKKLILRCVLISLLAAFIVALVSTLVMYFRMRDTLINQLVCNAQIYADLIEADRDAMENVGDFGDTRVTVLDLNGDVLFDSRKSETDQENHLNRVEIQAALNGTPRILERYSSTMGYRMYYYAVRAGTDSIVRVSEKAGNVGGYVGTGVLSLLLAMAVASGVSYLFARKTATDISAQMTEIKASLKSLNDGDYHKIETSMADEETFAVLTEINSLFDTVERDMSTIRDERSKLDFVLNHMNRSLLALDKEGYIILLNGRSRELFHASTAHEGQHYLELIDDITLGQKIENVRKNAETTFDYVYGGKDLAVSVRNMRDEFAQGINTIVLITDITATRAAERQKSEFFQNASHELKTPLTTIRGMSELMLARADNDTETKHAQRIFDECNRLESLVQDMLYISDLENRTFPENIEKVDLAAIAKEVCAEYGQIAQEKHLSFFIEGSASIQADYRQVYEVMGNVVGNAVHYNRDGGSVYVVLSETVSAATISVKDTGIGIAAEHIPNLCKRFYRVDKSRSKKTGGTGLGLAIVKHVAAVYGGAVEFKSKEGVGTTVTVTMKKKNKVN